MRPSPTPSEPITSTTNGTLFANVRGRRSIDVSRAARRSIGVGRTSLGALAFRALARALAWLVFFAGAGRSNGLSIGLVCGPGRDTRACRPGAEVLPARLRMRRDGAEFVVVRLVAAAGLSALLRRSLLRLFGASRLALMNHPSRLPIAAIAPGARLVAGPATALEYCGDCVRSQPHSLVRRVR